MDAIANLIVSKLQLKEKSLKVTLNYGLIVHGHFIVAYDFERLATERAYRFLPDEHFNKYKKHLSLYNDEKLSLTIIVKCSQLQKIEYYDPIPEPTFNIPELNQSQL